MKTKHNKKVEREKTPLEGAKQKLLSYVDLAAHAAFIEDLRVYLNLMTSHLQKRLDKDRTDML